MRRVLIVLLLLALAAGGAAALWWLRIPTVSVVQPTRGPAVQAVYATGVVEPERWAKVTPLVRGRIAEICSCEGKPVRAGDRLARLDDAEVRAQIAELRARATFLAAEVDRYRTLVERRVTSTQAYERAVSDLGQARAAIAAATERLKNYDLRAPMDGIVLRKDGEVGEIAELGQALFWVGEERPLWIVAEVDEEDIPLVRPGQKTLIKADAFPGRALEGTVARITPKGDPIAKNYRVRIALPDDTPLLVGMTTELNIVVRRVDSTLLVPLLALSGKKVWTVSAGRARARTVQPGIVGGGKAEILSGLSETDRVIVEPPAGLREGQRVRVVASSGK